MSQAIYSRITATMIERLEAGCIPWIKPWTTSSAEGLPYNYATRKSYQGINILALWCAEVERDFPRSAWMTYHQAKAEGYQVKKGAKAAYIIKVITGEHTDSDAGGKPLTDEGGDARPCQWTALRTYAVFNVAEISGIPEDTSILFNHHERIERAEKFVRATGAVIREGGATACYIPSLDIIRVPTLGCFRDAASYYGTLTHELTHWTAAGSRLDRKLGRRFGDDAYAAEELVAEMGSAFLCATLGIPGELQHANYLDHWLKILRADQRAIFTAAAAASKAADYLQASPARSMPGQAAYSRLTGQAEAKPYELALAA